MAIDQYEHSFQHLVTSDLPKYMADLEANMKSPKSMEEFSIAGSGVATLCRKFGVEADFPGCYVLMEGSSPVYVGISRSVLSRLRQHVRGTTHFDASLAYKIAAQRMPHGHTRAEAMEVAEFKAHFEAAKQYLQGLQVAFVKINNPLALYVFEPYCAMRFDTSAWNTFETH